MSQDELLELQRAIDDQGFTWQAGETSLSALSPEEQQYRLGLALVDEEMERILTTIQTAPPMDAQFPPAWDWRSVSGVDWTTPIRDQGGCGSCVAFGTVGVMETMLKRHENDAALQADLSEAHLFFCGCGNCCDRGWWPSNALSYAKSSGVPDEACFPYQDHNMPCADSCDDWQKRATRVVDWKEVTDAGMRKEWLSTTGPMVACMAVYRDFFSYKSGVYRHTSGDLAGHHAICAVGYSEAENCWICKNSWGTDWGEAGWFKIGYGECGIDTEFAMYGVTDVVPGGEPGPGPDPEPDGCWTQIKQALGLS